MVSYFKKYFKFCVILFYGNMEKFFDFSFFFCLFKTAPMAYGRSQTTGSIRAATTNLHHSHGNAGSLTHWARPGFEPAVIMDTGQVHYHWATVGSFFFSFSIFLSSFKALGIHYFPIQILKYSRNKLNSIWPAFYTTVTLLNSSQMFLWCGWDIHALFYCPGSIKIFSFNSLLYKHME